ncbi:hypothetical protein O1R50_00690 [Glycomyces luteolus]|uniref:DUF3618 domain-containing protein n=1 Tax=Glycomyces luteolus TaxID=2670330 RepID=A0A9X3SNE5_9ACTN|nr:hypothetical protein [Glycomyces luteolus]MDA1358122.1 hypothetical protein [Glycomyces luteolus]
MTGWTVPPSAAVPPGAGLAPPPAVGMSYQPEDERPEEEENLVRQRDWALQDAEADQHKSTADLEKDAERTRVRVNDSVQELRARLGLDPDTGHAHGPFAPVRRHPYTVVIAVAGAAAATAVGARMVRDHRRASKAARAAAREAVKTTERRRKAARKAARKRWAAAKDVFGSAATAVQRQRKKTMKRLTHR